jgi:LPXTG-motif cell wall-anchored protein
MAFVRRARRTAVPAVLAAAAAALIGIGWSSPAFANSSVDINSGNVPTTASGFANHDCDSNFGGGPYQGADVWVFVLPGDHNDTGDFVTVTAKFDTDGDGTADVTKTIPTDTPSGIVLDSGTSKAWIQTTAGWTLIDATAEITGVATSFNLTHTCPASGSPSTPPGVPSGSPSASVSPSSSMSSSSSPSGSVAPSPSTSSSSSTLPLTGTSLTPFIVAGVLLVAGGSVLVVMARRRRLNG